MLSEPQIVERAATPYVGIGATVTPPFGPVLDALFPELFGWVGVRGLEWAGPPLIRYHTTDMTNGMGIEVGVPVKGAAAGDGRVRVGELPAGPYVVATHTGPYDGLLEATKTLLDWAAQRGIQWATTDDGRWLGRVEFYATNPAEEPDQSKWLTELAFLTRR
jgi:effector-binding domain-containing protein